MVHENMGQTLLKKWSFPLRIFSVNVTKSPFLNPHLLKKSLMENFVFCAVNLITSTALLPKEILCIEYIIKKIFIHFLGRELEIFYVYLCGTLKSKLNYKKCKLFRFNYQHTKYRRLYNKRDNFSSNIIRMT